MEERLQKLLSAAGVCSRRASEEYISAGRVTVNGRVASLGEKADTEKDQVAVDGVPLRKPERFRYLMLCKPCGYVTTLADERGRKTVADLVQNCGGRVWPVGRLDLDSEGLLLMTDDGDLTQKMMHPSHQMEKEYHVWVTGDMMAALPLLRGKIVLDDVELRPAKVTVLGGDKLSVVIHEGKNRQVRRMCTYAGLLVKRLKRVREGSLLLGDLPSGQWRALTEQEVARLKES
ncbi:MAG: pseudouridine synthase [Oscillospiraceae bacterium]